MATNATNTADSDARAIELQRLFSMLSAELVLHSSILNFGEARLLCEACNIDKLTGGPCRRGPNITIDFDTYLAGFRAEYGNAMAMCRTSCREWHEYVRLNNGLIRCAVLIADYERLRRGDADFIALTFRSCPFGINEWTYREVMATCYDARNATSFADAPPSYQRIMP